MATTNSTTNRDAPLVSIRVPRNLRSVWPYPNLQHFQKYVDLMLLSATNERVAYNKTFVYVPAGYVLLKYAFFAQRWKMAYNTTRSFLNVLAISGWLQIRHLECRTISNRMVKAPFLAFPKIGYDNRVISIVVNGNTTSKQNDLMSVSDYHTNSYEKFSQRSGNNGDSGDNDYIDVCGDSGDNDCVDVCGDSGDNVSGDSGDDNGVGDVFCLKSDSYEELPQYSGHTSEHSGDNGDDNGDDALIIYKKEGKKDIKKNKKEKELIPTLEDIQQYCNENTLTFVDPQHFYSYYSASDWLDKNGKIIQNWQRLLVQTNQKNKRRKTKTPATSPSRPTATDKLARQNANLARDLAANLASNK